MQLESCSRDARKDPHSAAVTGAQSLARIACVLDAFPTGLQEQPLLGIDTAGLAGRDAEQRRVELAEPLEKPAPFAVAARLPLRIEETLHLPAVGRDLLDALPAGFEVFPELLEGVRLRIVAADSDDRDGLAMIGCDRRCSLGLGQRRRRGRRFGQRRPCPAGALGRAVRDEELADFPERRVFEKQRPRQPLERGGKPRIQLRDDNRVDSIALQGRLDIDVLRVEPCHFAKQRNEFVLDERRRCRDMCATPVDGGYLRSGIGQRAVEGLEARLSRQRIESGFLQQTSRYRIQLHPATGPQRPVDGERTAAALSA